MEPLTPQDPRMVGPYELRGRLGAGGMGTVYFALSLAGRPLAVKVIHPQFASDPEFRERFRREVEAAKAVSGAFTAPVVAAGPGDDPPWLATSYIQGRSLADVIAAHGPWPEEAVWRLAAGLAEALDAVHSSQVVHRDLKPANVLLAADGPRVIDFGIAQPLRGSRLTATGKLLGTPGFMSPEQVMGRPITPASDVFSFASVLVFAASGNGPFGDADDYTMAYRIVHEPPELGSLTGPLRRLVTECLAKEAAARPPVRSLLARIAAAQPDLPGAPAQGFWPVEIAAQISNRAGPIPTRAAPAQPGPDLGLMQAVTRSPVAAPATDPPAAGDVPASRVPPDSPPAGLSRRRVLIGAAGVSGVAALGLVVWIASGRPGEPGHAGSGQRTGASRPTAGHGTPARQSQPSGSPSIPAGTAVWSVPVSLGAAVTATDQWVYAPGNDDYVYAIDAATGKKQWRYKTGGRIGAPVTLAGGVVYFGSSDHHVYAVRAADGSLIWRYLTGYVVESAPAVSDGIVYVGGGDGKVYALDGADGRLSWTFATASAIYSDIAVVGGSVYVGSYDHNIYAIGAATGRVLWSYSTGGNIGPGLAVQESRVVAGSWDKSVYALESSNGTLQWRFPTNGVVGSAPVIAGGSVYVGSNDDNLYAIALESGAKIWAFPTGGSVWAKAAVAAGTIYTASLDGHVYALASATGKLTWSFLADGPIGAGPTLANGTVYAVGPDRLYALKA